MTNWLFPLGLFFGNLLIFYVIAKQSSKYGNREEARLLSYARGILIAIVFNIFYLWVTL